VESNGSRRRKAVEYKTTAWPHRGFRAALSLVPETWRASAAGHAAQTTVHAKLASDAFAGSLGLPAHSGPTSDGLQLRGSPWVGLGRRIASTPITRSPCFRSGPRRASHGVSVHQ
jgi:hypothetical protein